MALEHLPRRPLDDDLTLIRTAGLRSWLLGLSGLDALPADEALLLRTPCVDTMKVSFPIDLIWLKRDGSTVHRIDRGVQPQKIRVCLRSTRVLECAAGQADRWVAALARDREQAADRTAAEQAPQPEATEPKPPKDLRTRSIPPPSRAPKTPDA